MKPSLSTFFFLLIFTGCTSQSAPNPTLVANTATFQPIISKTSLPTETQTSIPTLTPTRVRPTVPAATLNAQATSAVLESLCDEFESDSTRHVEISSDRQWVSISCGYKRNRTLIVQNRDGVKWIFHYIDFIDPSLEGGLGGFTPLAWSPDNRFFYFSKVIGYSGGGNQCFPGGGDYGLYRLNLKTGSIVTLVSSDGLDFPGDKIRFSPTNEFYAINRDGVTIGNTISGKETKIAVSGVMEMIWSPDGTFLSFSTASCGETLVESSSLFVWNSSTNQTKVLLSTKDMLLRPHSWIDNSTLRFEGERWCQPPKFSTNHK